MMSRVLRKRIGEDETENRNDVEDIDAENDQNEGDGEDESGEEQDTLVIKAPKKSPLILRMVVLLFSMYCGVYICTICLKQITHKPNPNLYTSKWSTITNLVKLQLMLSHLNSPVFTTQHPKHFAEFESYWYCTTDATYPYFFVE